MNHSHQRLTSHSPLDEDHLIAMTYAEGDGFAGFVLQFLHVRQGVLAHRDTLLKQIAEFEQTNTELITAGIDALHHALIAHRTEDAVGGRRMQARGEAKIFQVNGAGRCGERIE